MRRSSRPDLRPPGEPRAIGYLYVLPAATLFGLAVLYPIAQTVWYSFYSWPGAGPSTYIGFANYGAVFSDPEIRGAFGHVSVLVIFYCVVPVVWGLMLATALSRIRVRGMTFFRTVLFLPQVLASVVVGTSWLWLLGYDGPVNAVLRDIGLGSLARVWLGDYSTALAAVGLVGGWVTFGFCMVLFLSGIQQIPRSLYEAARIDGANVFQEFFAVTLPGLRYQISVALVVTIIDALATFDLIYIMTSGGPGTSTTLPSYLVYQQLFANGQVGLGSAVAISLTVVIFVVALGVSRLGERRS